VFGIGKWVGIDMEIGEQTRKRIFEKANEIEEQLEELAIELEEEGNITAIGIREILSTVHKRFDEILLRR
jgi:hypothetical protein